MRRFLSKLRIGQREEAPPALVQSETPALQGAEMAVAYFSSRAGGDFSDFTRVGSHRFLFGLLDVAGKREQSRPVLLAAQDCFRSAGAELFSGADLNEPEAMTELARRLNLEVMRAAGGVRSCPAFAGCYNEELGTVCYFNAGHTPGLLRDDSSILELPATGLPLGLFSLSAAESRIVGLGQKSSMVVVSRGVVEAQCQDEEFGLAGVKHVLTTGAEESASALSRGILEQVQAFMCKAPTHNDVTALTLVRAN
jgi:serine phosphatase RsbU (regulator of sigma subunit)